MKRVITFVFVTVILLSCSVPCFAESENHNVYAKFVECDVNCSRTTAKDGQASVTLSNGIIVSVNSISSDNYLLYVKQIDNTDKKAMQWFSRCLSDKFEVIYPFDICLTNENGLIELSNDVDIQITFPKSFIDKVFFIDTDGNVVIPDSANKNNTISFKSKLNSYCVIAPAEQQPSSPQTGDNSHLYLWYIIAAGSLFILFFLFAWRRLKDEEA